MSTRHGLNAIVRTCSSMPISLVRNMMFAGDRSRCTSGVSRFRVDSSVPSTAQPTEAVAVQVTPSPSCGNILVTLSRDVPSIHSIRMSGSPWHVP